MGTKTQYHYPSKLGRFNKGCMGIYFSEPIAKGIYKITSITTTASDEWLNVAIQLSNEAGYFAVGGIFSSGIISGEVLSYTSGTAIIKIHKDSFVSLTAKADFVTNHSNIWYNYEILRSWNRDTGAGNDTLVNAFANNINVSKIERKQSSSTYSPFNFRYSLDFHNVLSTKTFSFTDLSFVEDLYRAASVVLYIADDSMTYDSELTDTPDVIGISGDTALAISQPYFGGLQDNMWYRAELIDDKIEYMNGRYKGKFIFNIKG